MSEIKWPRGLQMATLKKLAQQHRYKILNGTMLAIDPASINVGYAVTKKGEVVETGTINLNPRAEIHHRLQELVNILRADGQYDVLAIELIRGKMAHAYLNFSVGAILGAVNTDVFMEVPINAWKALAGSNHTKSDANDAEMIAKTVITIAKEFG